MVEDAGDGLNGLFIKYTLKELRRNSNLYR